MFIMQSSGNQCLVSVLHCEYFYLKHLSFAISMLFIQCVVTKLSEQTISLESSTSTVESDITWHWSGKTSTNVPSSIDRLI